MTLTFGSLFTGIAGFDLGLEHAGLQCAWQVEIDDKCQRVLERHWPNVPRYGDVKDVGRRNLEPVDLICGGFPCQDVSVAGQRKGLAGERSGLWFEFHRVLAELEPRWVIVENVPGLLSSNGGRDFATIVRGLVQLRYGVCWRVLDAQYFGVAQRRRRVFIVGHLGDGRAAQVLFEREGSAWDSTPSREAGQRPTRPIAFGSTINHYDESQQEYIVSQPSVYQESQYGIQGYDTAGTLREGRIPEHQMVAYGFSQESDGSTARNAGNLARPITGRHGDPGIVAYGVSENQRAECRLTPYVRQITSGGGKPGQGYPCVAYGLQTANSNMQGPIYKEGLAWTVQPHPSQTRTAVGGTFGVRRLTPTECERLQGFPDGWTDGQADTSRYRQLGNAVCVPVAEWLGKQLLATLDKLE